VATQIAAGKLGEGGVADDGRRLAKPVADEREGLLGAAHRSADGDSPKAGEHEHVHQRLPLRAHVRGRDSFAKLAPRERPFLGQGALDHRDSALRSSA